MAEHASRLWVTLQCSSRFEPLKRMAEHVSSLWVAVKFLSRSVPLMRMAENTSSEWVPFQSLRKLEPLMKMAEHAGSELLFNVWAVQNHWQVCMDTIQDVSHSSVLSRSESLIRRAGQGVSCSPADQNHWQEWLNTHLASELLLCVWADQNHWLEWLNTHPGSKLPSRVWADQIHWQEWLNTYPLAGSESFEQIRFTDKNGWTYT